jgi:hypothetical protein
MFKIFLVCVALVLGAAPFNFPRACFTPSNAIACERVQLVGWYYGFDVNWEGISWLRTL